MRSFALAAVCLAAVLASPAAAKVEKFTGIRIEIVKTDGATIYVRVGGKGPAVVMLHGFGDTGDMWAPLANALIKDHTVIVPDLRGMGLSSLPASGYDKKTQGHTLEVNSGNIDQLIQEVRDDETATTTGRDTGRYTDGAFCHCIRRV